MSKNTKLIVKQVKSAIGRQGNQRKRSTDDRALPDPPPVNGSDRPPLL